MKAETGNVYNNGKLIRTGDACSNVQHQPSKAEMAADYWRRDYEVSTHSYDPYGEYGTMLLEVSPEEENAAMDYIEHPGKFQIDFGGDNNFKNYVLNLQKHWNDTNSSQVNIPKKQNQSNKIKIT